MQLYQNLSADFSVETQQTRKEWQEIFKAMKWKNLPPRLINPVSIAFRFNREIEALQQKLQEFSNGTPLQYFCLENPMDGGALQAAVHGGARSWTRLSDFTFTFYFHALEKEMAMHSSVLAWRIPGTGKPGGLPSMGSHRVGHD